MTTKELAGANGAGTCCAHHENMAALVEELNQMNARNHPGVDTAVLGAAANLEAFWTRRHGNELDELAVRAALLAVSEHTGQHRKSGECYSSHPLEVATLVADLGLDAAAVAAACCHDIIEDCAGWDRKRLAGELGNDVADLVEALTKVDKARDTTDREATAATVTKLIVFVAGDVRAIAIKLADRLHNLRTISSLSQPRRERMATETLEVFSPLAHRLGMETLRFELEDLSFAQRYPTECAALQASLDALGPELSGVQHAAAATLGAALDDAGVQAEVAARTKHLYSIYSKLTNHGIALAEMHDLVGLRIIAADVAACYQVLGIVHTLWRPVPGRFKDYIGLQKKNGYQSLHTTVRGPEGREVEIQIRTRVMHLHAAYGVAAHYLYKAGEPGRLSRDNELVDALGEATSPDAFYELLRGELAPDGEIVVLTPRGDHFILPARSTAIDFAYRVHTDVGEHCVGAKVNGRLMPIRSELHSGDVVEVLTSPTATPSQDWLDGVQTAKAREKIRRYFADPKDPVQDGRTMLESELRSRRAPLELLTNDTFLSQLAKAAGLKTGDELFVALAHGNLRAGKLHGLPPRVLTVPPAPEQHVVWEVDAMSYLSFQLARCCNPSSTDDVVGYVTASRGISVHRADCSNYRALVQALPPGSLGRLVPLPRPGNQRAFIEVRSGNRPGLLRDLTDTFSALGVNLRDVSSSVSDGHEVVSRFELDLADNDHLSALVARLRGVASVASVASSS